MAARVDDILSRIEASHPDGRGFFSLLETAWGSNAQLGIPAHNVRLEALHGMGGTGCWDFGNGSTRCPTIFPGGGSLGAPRACIISTRILGRRTAPLPPVLIPDRVPHGFHPKILVLCSSGEIEALKHQAEEAQHGQLRMGARTESSEGGCTPGVSQWHCACSWGPAQCHCHADCVPTSTPGDTSHGIAHAKRATRAGGYSAYPGEPGGNDGLETGIMG